MIIKPKAEIVESTGSVLKDIERVGRICYKTEDRITGDSAESFVSRVAARKHMSVLEFGMIRMTLKKRDIGSTYLCASVITNEYLSISGTSGDALTITGSIRAFKEFLEEFKGRKYSLQQNLADRFPCVFDSTDTPHEEWDMEIPHDTHTLVKFTVNRAISHQLVRHRVFSFMQESQRYCNYDNELNVIEPIWFEKGSRLKRRLWLDNATRSHECYKSLRRSMSPQECRDVLPTCTKTELYMLGSNERWSAFFDLRCSSGADPEMRRVAIPLKEKFKSTGRLI